MLDSLLPRTEIFIIKELHFHLYRVTQDKYILLQNLYKLTFDIEASVNTQCSMYID